MQALRILAGIKPCGRILSTTRIAVSIQQTGFRRYKSEDSPTSKMPFRKNIVAKGIAPPLAPYSQAVLVNDTLYISGQIGATETLEILEGFENQARQALKNLGAILAASGATYDNVVKVSIFTTDLSKFDILNRVYLEFFKKENLPARSAFEVAGLPKACLVEIEAIAVLGNITVV